MSSNSGGGCVLCIAGLIMAGIGLDANCQFQLIGCLSHDTRLVLLIIGAGLVYVTIFNN